MEGRESVREKLLSFITGEQEEGGWFRSSAFSKDGAFHEKLPTPYFSLLIGTILTQIDHPSVERPLERVVKAIKKEKSAANTFNYWLRASKPDKQRKLPDDWDDTALAYILLLQSGEAFEPFAYPELKNSRTAQELFQTWLLPKPYPEKWQDQDLWVNLNICYWLALEGVVIEEAWKTVLREMEKESHTSRYYLNRASAYFFFARAARPIINLGKLSNETSAILQLTRARARAMSGHGCDTITRAWCLATLRIATGKVPKEAPTLSRAFLKAPHRAEPAILGWQQGRGVVYDYAPALTASLLLLALSPENQPKRITYHSTLPSYLKTLVSHLQKSDFTLEIRELPWEVARLVGAKTHPKSSLQADANLAAWAYYWLDDQELDKHPHPFTLPLNRVWETTTSHQEKVLPKHREPAFWKRSVQVGRSYKKASSLELASLRFHPCRLYKPIPLGSWDTFYSAKFGPYLLAVEASLTTLGQSTAVKARYRQLYQWYLLAKQYSDDARDCLEDLQAGRVTVCTELVLLHTQKPVTEYSDKELERLFLEHAAEIVSSRILKFLKKAENQGRSLGATWFDSSLKKRIFLLRLHTVGHIRHRKEVARIQRSSISTGNS